MKYIVDRLPYRDEESVCPFAYMNEGYVCPNSKEVKCCPRYWDNEFANSKNNPQECYMMIEFTKYQRKHAFDNLLSNLALYE